MAVSETQCCKTVKLAVDVPENRADQGEQNGARLDAIWGTLPDNVKSGILTLFNAAVKPQKGCVASGQNCSQVASPNFRRFHAA